MPPVSLSARIRYHVGRCELTVEEIGRRVGVHPSAVSHWCREGATLPTQENLERLVGVLGLTMQRFYAPIRVRRTGT